MWGPQEQDQEDFEQELAIRKWLEETGQEGAIELNHIGSTGRAKNTLLVSKGNTISLDYVPSESSDPFLHEHIAGSDGREVDDDPFDPEAELTRRMKTFLSDLNLKKGDQEWITETLLLNAKALSSSNNQAETGFNLEETPSISSIRSLVSPQQFPTFETL